MRVLQSTPRYVIFSFAKPHEFGSRVIYFEDLVPTSIYHALNTTCAERGNLLVEDFARDVKDGVDNNVAIWIYIYIYDCCTYYI